jgi:hypothetical protein
VALTERVFYPPARGRAWRPLERTCARPGCNELVIFEVGPKHGYRAVLVEYAVCSACGSAQRLIPDAPGGPEMHWLEPKPK